MTEPETPRRRAADRAAHAVQFPAREMRKGHRISLEPGWRPIQTRRYPAWWWPFEIMARWQARLARHLDEELRRGLERIPPEE
jgi:hypothetical protein